jgi:cell division protein FtsB
MTSRLKFVIGFLTFLLIILQLRLWVGDGGVRQVSRLKTELQRETEMAHALKERNETLEAEVQDLKTRLGALEERARTDLGMIKETETFFQHAQTNDKS